MGWFGKIVGGTVGFMVGGPLGAAVGAAMGHGLVDGNQINVRCPNCQKSLVVPGEGSYQCESCGKIFVYESPKHPPLSDNEKKQFIFFTATFSLLAKISKADGVVSKDELILIDDFMRKSLNFNEETVQVAREIFNQAKLSEYSYEAYANQFYSYFRDERNMVSSFFQVLFAVAMADKVLHPEEEKMLRGIKVIFELSDEEYNRIQSQYIEDHAKYYAVLGVNEDAGDEEIKKKYRSLVKQFHPDTIESKGLPKEFMEFANQKFNEIHEAYNKVKSARNGKP
ncbi:MAG: DnaJ domain-containing protein [bacterium]|nr:DnaJ domain-containing protein [bacterium]